MIAYKPLSLPTRLRAVMAWLRQELTIKDRSQHQALQVRAEQLLLKGFKVAEVVDQLAK